MSCSSLKSVNPLGCGAYTMLTLPGFPITRSAQSTAGWLMFKHMITCEASEGFHLEAPHQGPCLCLASLSWITNQLREFVNSITHFFFFCLLGLHLPPPSSPLLPSFLNASNTILLVMRDMEKWQAWLLFSRDQGQEFLLGRQDEHKVKLASRALITPMKSAPNLAPLHTPLHLQRLNYRLE